MSPGRKRWTRLVLGSKILDFNQPQLNLLDTDMLIGLLIKTSKRLRCKLGLISRTIQTEILSTTEDLYVKSIFYLSEVFIQHTTKIGQTPIISG